MGLTVDIYRSKYQGTYDILNGFTSVVLTNVEGPSKPSALAPAATLVIQRDSIVVKPDLAWMVENGQITQEQVDGGSLMDSGVLAATSDSRLATELRRLGFPGYIGLKVHSYLEPWVVTRSMD